MASNKICHSMHTGFVCTDCSCCQLVLASYSAVWHLSTSSACGSRCDLPVVMHRRKGFGITAGPAWTAWALRALSLGFPPRVLWHMHLLGAQLFMSLLFFEPAPRTYAFAFLHYAVGCFVSLFGV